REAANLSPPLAKAGPKLAAVVLAHLESENFETNTASPVVAEKEASAFVSAAEKRIEDPAFHPQVLRLLLG
ncbi:unnamed protein product, partial [Amoebophrya sp. A25]